MPAGRLPGAALAFAKLKHMARVTPKQPVRGRKPKAEVLEEFSRVSKEVDAAREVSDAKTAQALALREAEVRQAVEALTVEGVVSTISALGLEVSKALSGISAKLVEEVDRLAAVREAVEMERKELERLHKIDVAATALDQLVQDYRLEKERLEAEIAARRADWGEEVRAAERERREQEEALKRQRQREIEEYEYKKALERKKAQDKYEEEIRLLERKNKEKQEALEKDWQQREAALKEREQELAALRKEVAEFPARLKAETERAVSEAVRSAEQRFQQSFTLLNKDAEGERRLAELRIKTLEETVERQAAQIATLEKQLNEAKQQVQDIAVKAIEGASGAKALAAINQIAMEQARQRPRTE